MKKIYFILSLLWICTAVAAQDHKHHYNHEHPQDSTDVFYRHLKLNEVTVTGVTGELDGSHLNHIGQGTQTDHLDQHHRRHRPPAWCGTDHDGQRHLETHHPRTGLQPHHRDERGCETGRSAVGR